MASDLASTLLDTGPPLPWWQRLVRGQDRLIHLAPLAAVLLFLAAIATAFWYLRLEEVHREQDAVKRDVEYSQQRLRLRLLERQEQFMRLARDISDRDMSPMQFDIRAESLVLQYPELMALSWIDDQRRLMATQTSPSVPRQRAWVADGQLKRGEVLEGFDLARDLRQPVYTQPLSEKGVEPVLYMHVPITPRAHFAGELLAEFSVDGLLRYGVPAEVLAKYAVALFDGKEQRAARTFLADTLGAQRDQLEALRALPPLGRSS